MAVEEASGSRVGDTSESIAESDGERHSGPPSTRSLVRRLSVGATLWVGILSLTMASLSVWQYLASHPARARCGPRSRWSGARGANHGF